MAAAVATFWERRRKPSGCIFFVEKCLGKFGLNDQIALHSWMEISGAAAAVTDPIVEEIARFVPQPPVVAAPKISS